MTHIDLIPQNAIFKTNRNLINLRKLLKTATSCNMKQKRNTIFNDT